MRGPKGIPVGTLKRVIMSNITSYGAVAELPSIISGVQGHMVEDIKIDNVYLHQVGGGTADMASLQPAENEATYPEPKMFGTLPASGFFVRHVKNLEFGNVEIVTERPDSRPAFWLENVAGADFFRVKTNNAQGSANFRLKDVSDFRVFGSRSIKDFTKENIDRMEL